MVVVALLVEAFTEVLQVFAIIQRTLSVLLPQLVDGGGERAVGVAFLGKDSCARVITSAIALLASSLREFAGALGNLFGNPIVSSRRWSLAPSNAVAIHPFSAALALRSEAG